MIKTEYIDNIVENINVRGNYVCRSQEVNKNGVTLQGISFKINPTIYATIYPPEEWFEDEEDIDIDNIASILIDRFEESKASQGIPNNILQLVNSEDLDRDLLFSSICLCVRKQGINDGAYTFKIPIEGFEDLDAYIRIFSKEKDYSTSAVLSNQIIERFEGMGITKEELRFHAQENTRNSVSVTNMFDAIEKLKPSDMEMPPKEFLPPLYVVTNSSNIYESRYGAGIMSDKTALNKVCEEIGEDKIVIIPSSIHEVLVVPYKDAEVMDLDNIIRAVNIKEVSPTEVLSNHHYVYSATK